MKYSFSTLASSRKTPCARSGAPNLRIVLFSLLLYLAGCSAFAASMRETVRDCAEIVQDFSRFQVGGLVTDFVIILNTQVAVRAFARGGNVEFGGALSVAAGPVGRAAEAGILPVAAVYTYSRSQGLFAGASLEGTILIAQSDKNARYYGGPVTPDQILIGRVPPPPSAKPLITTLSQY